MDFLGFGRESARGAAATTPDILISFLRGDEEKCELCGSIRKREEMTVVACDAEDGGSRYACLSHARA